LTDLRGQVVVINFWASWCLECRVEAAALERTWRDYRARGVTFVGIDWLDTEKEALEYIRRYGVTYPNGPDLRGRIGRTYYLTGVPETIIIDRQGRIVPIESQSDGAPPLPKIVGPLTQGGLLDEAGLRRVLDGLLSDS
jgi:cytochrome c biogenesis protein CcmG/thiol:disulfide interchange protein DsbE